LAGGRGRGRVLTLTLADAEGGVREFLVLLALHIHAIVRVGAIRHRQEGIVDATLLLQGAKGQPIHVLQVLLVGGPLRGHVLEGAHLEGGLIKLSFTPLDHFQGFNAIVN